MLPQQVIGKHQGHHGFHWAPQARLGGIERYSLAVNLTEHMPAGYGPGCGGGCVIAQSASAKSSDRERSALELQPLALEDGLEKPESVSIWNSKNKLIISPDFWRYCSNYVF